MGHDHSNEIEEDSELIVNSSMFIKQHAGNFDSSYKLQKKVGEGGFGSVYICEHIETKEQRAVKIISIHKISKKDLALTMEEMKILASLDHPNIVKIYEYFLEKKNFYIVMDLIQGGELYYEITERHHFSEKDAALLIKQVLSAVSVCHSHDIIHCDIKPENILLESSKDLDQVKLIDFGQAKHAHSYQDHLNELCGTGYYQAPEVIKRDYGKECDIWSIGVITYVLMSGYPPFNGKNDQEIRDKVLNGNFEFKDSVWKSVSEEGKNFISYLLTYDRTQRPTASEALQHVWLSHSELKINPNFTGKVLTNLIQFHSHISFKAAVLNYIGSQLVSKKDREELGRLFKSLDTKGHGSLDKEEVQAAYKQYMGVNLTQDELEKIFAAVDTDHSGCIEYSEFVVACENQNEMLSSERLMAAFKLFDKDGSGQISVSEIGTVLSGSGKKVPKKIIKGIMQQVDKNGDGQISFDEFKAYMNNPEL